MHFWLIDYENLPIIQHYYEDNVLSVNVRRNERDEVLSQTRSLLLDNRISSATNVLVCRKSKDKSADIYKIPMTAPMTN